MKKMFECDKLKSMFQLGVVNLQAKYYNLYRVSKDIIVCVSKYRIVYHIYCHTQLYLYVYLNIPD